MRLKLMILPTLILLGSMVIEAQAQCINGTKSYPIYKKGATLVKGLDGKGLEIVRIEYDLVFDTTSTYRKLHSSWEYMIVGFADDGVKDLDVKIYQYDELLETWDLVAQDNSADHQAIVTFRPETTSLYKIDVVVYRFEPGYTAARYGLLFVHE